MKLNRTTSLILFGLIVIIGIVLATTQNTREVTEIVIDQSEDMVSMSSKEVFTSTDLLAGTYAIDTTQSSVTWTARKKVIQNYIDAGSLAPMRGMLVIDEEEHLTEGEVTVDVASLEVTETGVGGGFSGLARDLLSDRFLGVESFPEAAFVTTGIESGRKNSFEISGDLTIKGVTQPVVLTATVNPISLETIVLSGDLTIDRTDYGITFGSDRFFDDLGDRVIDDMVDLSISLQATRVE